MRIAILARQIRVDLLVVRPYCGREVDLAEVLLKAYSCGVLLGCGTWLPCLPRPILLLQGGGKPMGGRRPSAFCLALNGCVDFVTEFKNEGLTHTFPPASFRAFRPVRKSLRFIFEIVLRFLSWGLWRLTPAVSRAQWPKRGTSEGYCASAPVRC